MIADPFPQEVPMIGRMVRFTVLETLSVVGGEREVLLTVETTIVSRIWDHATGVAELTLATGNNLIYDPQDRTQRVSHIWAMWDAEEKRDRDVGEMEIVASHNW